MDIDNILFVVGNTFYEYVPTLTTWSLAQGHPYALPDTLSPSTSVNILLDPVR